MNYEKKYKEALERAKEWMAGKYSHYVSDTPQEIAEFIFPELKESEDERTRKEILSFCQDRKAKYFNDPKYVNIDKWIAWLEKQCEKKELLPQANERAWLYLVSDVLTWKDGIGQYLDNPEVQKLAKKLCKEYKQRLYNPVQDVPLEQNPIQRKDFISTPFGTDSELISEIVVIPDGCVATIEDNKIHIKREEKTDSTDNIEPKFKVGDWIISHYNHVAHIKAIDEKNYFLSCDNGSCERLSIEYIDRNWRLWTIADAKDGDVLANDHNILILKESVYDWYTNGTPYSVKAYCGIKPNGNFEIGIDNWSFCGTLHIHPATKEQRDILFTRIKENGYEWNADEKVLNKIIIYES